MLEPTSNEEPLSKVDHPLRCIYENEKGRCEDVALSLSSFCWVHMPDKDKWKKKILQRSEDLQKFILRGVDFTGIDFKGGNLSGADLSKAKLYLSNLASTLMFSTSLKEADLRNSDLTWASLNDVQLQGANLAFAKLHSTVFEGTQLQGANLSYTESQGAFYYDANLFDVILSNIKLSGDVVEGEGSEKTAVFKEAEDLTKESFRRNIERKASPTANNYERLRGYLLKYSNRLPRYCRLSEKDLTGAEDGYRRLKQYFTSHGQSNDASWAAFKELKMQRKQGKGVSKIPMFLMEWLCGYGEMPWRVMAWAVGVIFLFACFYGQFHMLHPTQIGTHETLGLRDCLYSSIVTFTTLGFGEITPRPEFRLWVSIEALLGAMLMSLFVVTITRRYGAR